MSTIIVVAFSGIFGLIIGSFLNVVIWRVPRGESLVRPGSACPVCEHEIRARDNVPVLSWLVLGGRCRDCRAPISKRYPLVELGTGSALAAVALAVWAGSSFEAGTPFETLVPGSSATVVAATVVALVAFLYLAAVSIALAMIDLDTKRLPNAIVLPSIIVGGMLLAVSAALAGDWWAIARTAIGGAALFTFYFILVLVYPKGMGFGDVKLAAVLGLYLGFLGWGPLIVGAFAAFLLGGIFSIGLLLTRRATRKSGIPFGPWMLLGAWVGIFFGRNIAHGYLSLFGLS